MDGLLALLALVLTVVGVAILVASSVMMEAFALVHLWAWFITPYFTQAPALSFWACAGLVTVVSLLVTRSSNNNEKLTFAAIFAHVFIRPLFALGVGWIIYTYFV